MSPRIMTCSVWAMAHLLLLLSVSAAAATISTTISPSNATITTTLSPSTLTFKPVIIKPQINLVSPSNCINAGATVTISGSNFGNGSGRSLALLSGGSTIATIPASQANWSQSSIRLSFPNLSQLSAGSFYGIGIMQTGGGVLSNTDKGVTLCQTSSKITMSTISGSMTQLSAKTNSSTPTPAGANQAVMGGGLQGMGGNALQGQFPPPPKDVPPPPPKADRSIEPHELLVLSDNLKAAQALLVKARALGLAVKRRSVLKGLGFVVTVLRVPKQESSGKALLRLRKAMPKVWADVNRRYQLQGQQADNYGSRLIGWQHADRCRVKFRIGLLDTQVAVTQKLFHRQSITQRSFLAAGITPAPQDHATAIAALLLAKPQPSGLRGMLPQAHLYVAGIFRKRSDNAVDTTAEWIVRGLDWLVQQKVKIVNLSLGGQRNLLLEAAIQRILTNGIAVVAAAGNGGASGPAVYPAAQKGVIAVTAVDAHRAIYRHATHGRYIALSAPGVDIWTATPGKAGKYVSGTSFAAPYVSAVLAAAHVASPRTSWTKLAAKLEKHARDLGKPGKDPVFGWGLVQALTCQQHARRKH